MTENELETEYCYLLYAYHELGDKITTLMKERYHILSINSDNEFMEELNDIENLLSDLKKERSEVIGNMMNMLSHNDNYIRKEIAQKLAKRK